MKNLKNSIFIAIGLLTVSCRQEFIEDKPQTTLDMNSAISNELTLNTAVNGLYNYMQTNSDGTINSYGALIPTLEELLGDNAFVSLKNSNRFSLTRQTDLSFYTKNNGDVSTVWSSLYKIIANANFILANEGKISDNAATDETPEDLFAQAHAIRGMAYMTLLDLFSPATTGLNQNYGIPMPLTFDVSAKLGRSTVPTVQAQILTDLKFAEANLTNQTKTKLNPTAVQLLLSRYYLMVKDYSNANLYSQNVLDAAGSNLLTKTGVSTYFTTAGESSSETLFQIEYNSLDTPGDNDGITATWYSGGRYKQNYATSAFYNKLSSTDARKNVWYKNTGYVTSLPDNPKPIDVVKYTTSDRDIVVLRKTEAVFNQLEALYYTNPSLALTKLVAWVKNYRDANYTFSGTGTALLNEILQQKNNEFFLEGFRYSDLKRNGIGFTNPQTGVTLSPSMIQMQAFPIPLSELQTNSVIEQYPGY